jgi:hypothetical protein
MYRRPGRPARGSAPAGATFSCRAWPEGSHSPGSALMRSACRSLCRDHARLPRADTQDAGRAHQGRYLNRPDPPFGATEESSTFSSRGAQIRSLCAQASTESAESSASPAAHTDAEQGIGLHRHLDRPPNPARPAGDAGEPGELIRSGPDQAARSGRGGSHAGTRELVSSAARHMASVTPQMFPPSIRRPLCLSSRLSPMSL